jgi:hypothetical protein
MAVANIMSNRFIVFSLSQKSFTRGSFRLTATQRGARDAATGVNSDALPAGSRLNEDCPV